MTRLGILVLAASLGLNAGLAYMTLSAPTGEPDARPGARRPPNMAHVLDDHMRRMTESLKLDADQRASIESLHERLLPRILDRHEAVHTLRREVGDHYAAPTLDPAAHRDLVARLGQAQAELDALITEVMLAEAEVLTPEQRRTYAREMPWSRRAPPPPPPGDRPTGPPRGDHPPGPPPPGR